MSILSIDENWTLPISSEYKVEVTIQDISLYKTIFQPSYEKGSDMISELTELVGRLPIDDIRTKFPIQNIQATLKSIAGNWTDDIKIVSTTHPIFRRDYRWNMVWFQVSVIDAPVVMILLKSIK